ncbi:hypothetical protein [Lysinibacillus xylanilyticus]|uniref:hypothetical protein n=1 Tax=Lysinibacillus xylanilyticus TaxID=582475 RepID=UPI0013792C1A|nr:hypothetical protein [Lysinibacillus xylanilyticus]
MRKRSATKRHHEVGHEGVITEHDGFNLRSSIANPQEVALSPLRSTKSPGM